MLKKKLYCQKNVIADYSFQKIKHAFRAIRIHAHADFKTYVWKFRFKNRF